jgi:hypothetical protein
MKDILDTLIRVRELCRFEDIKPKDKKEAVRIAQDLATRLIGVEDQVDDLIQVLEDTN